MIRVIQNTEYISRNKKRRPGRTLSSTNPGRRAALWILMLFSYEQFFLLDHSYHLILVKM